MKCRVRLLLSVLAGACLGLVGCGNDAMVTETPGVTTETRTDLDKPMPSAAEVALAPVGGSSIPEPTPPSLIVPAKPKAKAEPAEPTEAMPTAAAEPAQIEPAPEPKPEQAAPADGAAMKVEVPLGLDALEAYVPADNPITQAKYELGRQLYFDPRVSLDATVSCATCHNPEKGWTDQLATSTGIFGQKGGRNAPTVINTVYGKTMFWDGRAPSLEAQSQGPPLNPIEMGMESIEQIVARFNEIPGYKKQFEEVFGGEVTFDHMAQAIASFERVASLSGNARYDRYVDGQIDALSEDEKKGMILFGLRLNPDDEYEPEGVTLQKGKCTLCHTGFNFTDEKFHNLGVGYDSTQEVMSDMGRYAVLSEDERKDSDKGSFKTPTLRDLADTAPYMHDGSEETLEEVMDLYDKGGNKNPWLDPDMKVLNLTPDEKDQIIAFMRSLAGEKPKVELPELPAGPDGSVPDARAALTPPGPKSASRDMHRFAR